jgi:hypothetical protein
MRLTTRIQVTTENEAESAASLYSVLSRLVPQFALPWCDFEGRGFVCSAQPPTYHSIQQNSVGTGQYFGKNRNSCKGVSCLKHAGRLGNRALFPYVELIL